jgi:hypothetical protein
VTIEESATLDFLVFENRRFSKKARKRKSKSRHEEGIEKAQVIAETSAKKLRTRLHRPGVVSIARNNFGQGGETSL